MKTLNLLLILVASIMIVSCDTKDEPQPQEELFCWECVQQETLYSLIDNSLIDVLTYEFLIGGATKEYKENYVKQLSEDEISGNTLIKKHITCTLYDCH